MQPKLFVSSYILSWLDYCNCLLMGAPNSVIQPLQKVQNFAARLIPCLLYTSDAADEDQGVDLGGHNIPFSDSDRNFGFILDSELSLKKHVIKICQSLFQAQAC